MKPVTNNDRAKHSADQKYSLWLEAYGNEPVVILCGVTFETSQTGISRRCHEFWVRFNYRVTVFDIYGLTIVRDEKNLHIVAKYWIETYP